jgi:hypothetical protein
MAQGRGRGIAPLFADLGTRRRWVISKSPLPLYPRERPSTHCTGGWVGPKTGLNVCEKSRPPPGFHRRTVEPVASHYTDWAIPAPRGFLHFYILSEWNFYPLFCFISLFMCICVSFFFVTLWFVLCVIKNKKLYSRCFIQFLFILYISLCVNDLFWLSWDRF